MSGGKGGGSSTSVQIPQWIQDPMQRGISRAEDMSRMGYQPYYGPEVAAFSPMQVAAMQSSADAASAFGLAPQMDVSAGIPTPTEYVGGVRGYGSGDIFEQSLNEFNKRQPDQAAIYNSLFAGPDVGRVDYGDNYGITRPVMGGSNIGGLTGAGGDNVMFGGAATPSDLKNSINSLVGLQRTFSMPEMESGSSNPNDLMANYQNAIPRNNLGFGGINFTRPYIGV